MNKSCRFCKRGSVIPGDPGDYWNPPTPDEIDCAYPSEELLIKHDYDPDELANYCGGYDPIIAEKCFKCGKEMNIPMHEVEHFFEEEPCCSEECAETLYRECFGWFDYEDDEGAGE